MRKYLVRLLFLLVIGAVLVYSAIYLKYRFRVADARNEIAKYKELLVSEPENCLYLEQIATWNQMAYELDEAIEYYERTLSICPENAMARFDLGVTHLVNKNYEKGVEHMDAAIQLAKRSGDTDLILLFETDKQGWLDNWDKIKELELNK